MGEIASYYIKGTRQCRCHLCQRTFDSKGAIRQHFIKSKEHWRLKKFETMPGLDSYFDELKRSNEVPEIRGSSTEK